MSSVTGFMGALCALSYVLRVHYVLCHKCPECIMSSVTCVMSASCSLSHVPRVHYVPMSRACYVHLCSVFLFMPMEMDFTML